MSPGLGVGSLSSPPLAGWLFQQSPMLVIYLAMVMVSLQTVTVVVMWAVTRGCGGQQQQYSGGEEQNNRLCSSVEEQNNS